MHAISDVSQPLGTVIDAVESCHVCCQCKVGDHEDRKEEVEEEKEMEEEEGEDEWVNEERNVGLKRLRIEWKK